MSKGIGQFMQALASKEMGAEFVRDAAWLPHLYDSHRDSLTFAYLPRDAQRAITFLDPRFIGRATASDSILDTFLRAIARRGMDGRVFARHMFHQFAPVNPLDSGVREDDATLQSDLQIAAQAWLMQISFMGQITKRFGDRIRVLNAETFLADPAKTLTQIGAFLDMKLTSELAQNIAGGGVFREHAKELGRPFDAAARKAQYDEAGAPHREEIMMTKDWARALAIRCGAPLVLPETMFMNAT